MAAYSIGQIIYIVLRGSHPIVRAAQVVEEITKRTVNGTTTSYIVNHNERSVPIESIEGEVFESENEVRTTLIARATASVEKLIERARAEAKVCFAAADEPSPAVALPSTEPRSTDETPVVILPDGSKAKIRSIVLPTT